MSYTSSDIRIQIRDTIGYDRYMYENDMSTVSVTDNWGDPVYLPLLLPSEVRGDDLPPMPFIEMVLISSPASNLNIGGDVRNMDVYMDFNIYYVDKPNITASLFGKQVSDEIIDKITSYRNSVPSSYYVEVINDGREIIEQEQGKSVVFHRVLEVHVKNFS